MPCVSFEYERVSLPAVLQAVDLRTTRNSSIGWPAGSVNRQIPDEAHLVGGLPAQFRALATRDAKRVASYRSEIIIAAIVLWLRTDLQDTP